MSICLPVYMSTCLYVYLSICPPVYMSTCLSVFMSICLSVYLSICLSVYLSTCLSVCYHGILYILTEHTYLKIINDHFTSSIYYIFYVQSLYIYKYNYYFSGHYKFYLTTRPILPTKHLSLRSSCFVINWSWEPLK